jgi:hypothetical protein
MEPIDIPASFQNLENMNKIQQREVSNPLMFAMRNSDEDNKRLEENLHRVNETEEADSAKINPDERRKQEQKKKKKEQKFKNRGVENGRFIDLSA